MKHIFIVGGTGMLRKVTENFIESGYTVTLMTRNPDNLQAIQAMYPDVSDRFFLISQNYREPDEALSRIKESVQQSGQIDLALLWIHKIGNTFAEKIIPYILDQNEHSIIYRILGSSITNPVKLTDKHLIQNYPDRYREIYLGFKKLKNNVRWLHDNEISNGVIKALESNQQTSIVGVINPWEMRPL